MKHLHENGGTPRDSFHSVRVFQVRSIVPVVLEIKGCVACGTQGVAGDDWREHGYFVFGEQLAVHISQLVFVRNLVQSGMPITTAWRSLLKALTDDLEWLQKQPALGKR